MTDEEKKYFDIIMNSLSPEHREREEADPLHVLIIVRGFQKENPRDQETIKAMKRIMDWRDKVGFYNFFDQHLPMEKEFYEWWPERIYGTDKYGHFLQVIRASEILADKFDDVDPDQIEKLQGQKMKTYGEYKRKISKEKGQTRYKHSLVIDMTGVSLNLARQKKRDLLKRIFDVGTHYYPETMWKIYLVNSPFLFRGIWAIVKPWLHPITVAKVNVLGSYKSSMDHMMKDGITPDQLPDWIGGSHKGQTTVSLLHEYIEQAKQSS
eukprot:CAMPEP_0184307202 /NCGR_PEP_ID=MMETSP1049-20130417/16014_1 /TAXON_ID=77928 /ORGANISM="Proteomonas sulcata, Strain CCMP704" /LENGTH=265 /DNA_ID=CAMNT_0026619645 /DNA_START=3 /DNA_END=800 /DNA_ORIENTATION=+